MKKLLHGMFLIAIIALTAVRCNHTSPLDDQIVDPNVTSKLITYSSDVIPGQYIVVLDASATPNLRAIMSFEEKQQYVSESSNALLAKYNIDPDKVMHYYGAAITGFAVSTFTEDEVNRILADPKVKYIEQDRTVSIIGGPPGGGGSCANNNSETTPCGIPVVGGGANYNGDKKAYVIDTGIDLDHGDLNVANYGFNAFTSGKDAGLPNDLNGHGSHVAGTIAAIGGNNKGVKGVAAGALVVPVKVLDSRGSGSNSGVIAGVNYVAGNAGSGDVANMSLGGSASQAMDDAVINASNNGIWFMVAAGNSSANAGNYSPARANGPYIRTIAAMTCGGAWASYSNYGVPPIDFIAPGSSICSTYKDNGYASLSGTSMATPHAAGVYLATNGSPSTCGNVTYNGVNYPKICM